MPAEGVHPPDVVLSCTCATSTALTLAAHLYTEHILVHLPAVAVHPPDVVDAHAQQVHHKFLV